MTMQHTAGPWRISVPQEEPGGFIGVHILAGAGAERWGVAKIYYGKDAAAAEKSTQAANARLIAAAPDLYEALKLAKSHIEHMAAWITARPAGYSFEALGEDMPSITAALAKATGQ